MTVPGVCIEKQTVPVSRNVLWSFSNGQVHIIIYPVYNNVFFWGGGFVTLGGINIKWNFFRDLNNTDALHVQIGKLLYSYTLYSKLTQFHGFLLSLQ